MKFAYQGMRALRWLLWIGFLGYCVHYAIYPENHIDHFGHLLSSTEAVMFGLPIAAVIAGLMELMLRDKAGITRKPAAAVGFDR